LRDLTRTRKQMVRERASHVQRIQKVLEDACLKLGDVLTDVMGKSGRAILQGLSEGVTDVEQLLGRIDRRVEAKREALRQALQGRLRAHHQLLLRLHLGQITALEQAIETIDREVGERLEPFRNQIERLTAIPGVSEVVAEVLAAEIGLDMSRFATDAHLRSWAGLCPRSDESAGKTRSRRTKPGDPWLKTMLVQAATSAARTKASYLGAQYRRLKGRRGHKRAVVAVAASILTIAYHLLRDGTTYQDLGVDYFQRREPEREAQRAVRKLKQLGYEVDLKKAA
jgi:transposase